MEAQSEHVGMVRLRFNRTHRSRHETHPNP
jgi:hypothetical protein